MSPVPNVFASSPQRARVLAAIGVTYLTRLLVAAIASYPLIASIDASGIGQFDASDGKLFEPGGLYLLEVLLHERDEWIALVAPTAVLLVAGSLAGVAPERLLLRALAGAPGATESSPRAVECSAGRALPRLVLLALATWVARALLVFATVALASTARSYFASARDERLPSIAASVAVLVGLCGGVLLSVVRDRAAIEITLAGATPLDAIERALGLLRRRGLGLVARFTGWTLAGFAAVLAGAFAASAFDVSTRRGAAMMAAAVLHQLAIVAQIALRTTWLSSAIAATSPPGEPRATERAQADAFL